ncbi:MAG: hypothetical protein ACJAVV_000749 [Alphaproteobacteria bacterium]|jgi:hypothetical protein
MLSAILGIKRPYLSIFLALFNRDKMIIDILNYLGFILIFFNTIRIYII